ncbi:hypothetical protein JCM16303_003659 [Sporobolomyces ruberrimus]
MPASLPPELLRLIIEATVPPSYHSTTFEDRKETLYRLCLVSRTFRQIARPLTFGMIKITSEAHYKKIFKLLETDVCAGEDVKMLALHSWRLAGQWPTTGTFYRACQVCPRLSDLSISVYPRVRPDFLDPLVHFKELASLRLYGPVFHPSIPLPSLRTLTLSGDLCTQSFCFDSGPILLPSLRYLALGESRGAFHNRPLADTSMLVQLLPQLDAWSITLADLHQAYRSGSASILSRFLSRALIDVDIEEDPFSEPDFMDAFDSVHHIRLLYFSSDTQDRDDFNDLVSALESRAKPLRSIFLNLPPVNHTPEVDALCKEDVEWLNDFCDGQGTEVIFEEQPCGDSTDPVVSDKFWTKMKLEQRHELNVSSAVQVYPFSPPPGPLLPPLSPSPIPPRTPPMSLDSLPPELLRLVLESTVPHCYDSTSFQQRHTTLRSLCLVSRRFRQIAQPVLFEVAHVCSAKQAELLIESLNALKGRDRRLGQLIEACPQVEGLHLAIRLFGCLHIDGIAHFAYLTSLQLSGSVFRLTVSLPSLRNLSIGEFANLDLDGFQSPLIFPALRYLAVDASTGGYGNNTYKDPLPSLPSLLEQVEAWSVDLSTFGAIQRSDQFSDFAPYLPRLLVDCYLSVFAADPLREDLLHTMRCLRILCHDAYQAPRLARITSLIQSSPPPLALHSIYLNDLRHSLDPTIHVLEGAIEDLRRVCLEKGIKVIFEEQPYYSSTDPLVSHEFWRRMKEQRSNET